MARSQNIQEPPLPTVKIMEVLRFEYMHCKLLLGVIREIAVG